MKFIVLTLTDLTTIVFNLSDVSIIADCGEYRVLTLRNISDYKHLGRLKVVTEMKDILEQIDEDESND